MFLNNFNMMMLKIIFFLKNIILLYFWTKNTLKNNWIILMYWYQK